MEKVKITRIKPDALVTVKIGAAFYERIEYLFGYIAAQKPMEEFKKTLEEMVNRTAQNEWEVHLETIMGLKLQIANKAKEQGLTEEHEIDLETVGKALED